MNKRGELTSGEITGIVLVIASTIVLLLFLPSILNIFGGGKDSRELCQLSVIARATVPSAGQQFVPLRCSTEKICLNKGENCRQFAGEEVTEEIRLNDDAEESKSKIEKAIADKMLECWQTMGEGKLDLFGDFSQLPIGVASSEDFAPVCVVCSRLAIEREVFEDEDFKKEVLEKLDVNSYINSERPSPSVSMTYAQLLSAPGIGAPSEDVSSISSDEISDQVAVIFSQVKVPENAFEEGLKIAGGNFMLLAGGTTLATSVPLVGGWISKVIGVIPPQAKIVLGVVAVAGVGATGVISGIAVSKAHSLVAGYCGPFKSTNKDLSTGCSIVRTIEWNSENVRAINEFCSGGIEGNL